MNPDATALAAAAAEADYDRAGRLAARITALRGSFSTTSRELSLVATKLDEAAMWARAEQSRHLPAKEA